jgi:hypothetical protein
MLLLKLLLKKLQSAVTVWLPVHASKTVPFSLKYLALRSTLLFPIKNFLWLCYSLAIDQPFSPLMTHVTLTVFCYSCRRLLHLFIHL